MDLLKKATNFKQAAKKPYIGFSKLPFGNHEVFNFRFVKNKLYNVNAKKPGLERVILAELEDQVLFLPEYFARVFENDDAKLAELNKGAKKYMYFGGKRSNEK